MFIKQKTNSIFHLRILSFTTAGFLCVCSQSFSIESNQFTEESPITLEEIIQAGLEPRRMLAQDQNLAWNLKDNQEDLSDADFFDFYQTSYATKDGKEENLIYMDKLHLDLERGNGSISLFRENNLTTHPKIYLDHINDSKREPGRLTSILYYFFNFSKDIRDKFCYVGCIGTQEPEQRKGYARFALNQLVETTFLLSSVSFINALIREENFPSQGLFKSLGFREYDGMLSLNGRITLIEPKRTIVRGNYYLSRFDWEKRKSKAAK